MIKYKVLIDTGLGYEEEFDVVASCDKDATTKALKACELKYNEDYTYSRKQATGSRITCLNLKRKVLKGGF